MGTANVKVDFVVTYIEPTPPIANDDRVMTEKDAALVIDVLANDSGTVPRNPAAVAIVSSPSGGQVIVDQATGRVTYTPCQRTDGPR